MGFIYKPRSITGGGSPCSSLAEYSTVLVDVPYLCQCTFSGKAKQNGTLNQGMSGRFELGFGPPFTPAVPCQDPHVRWTQQPRSTRVRSSQTTGLIVGDSVEL